MRRAGDDGGAAFRRWLESLGQVVETHASLVVLTSDRALKFKKPLDLGFLDFSTREKRETYCRREVELNRRLAENVYRGVLPLYLGPDGYVLDPEPDSVRALNLELVDHAVSMRRLDERMRADVLLAEGRLDAVHLELLAERIARFHASLPESAEIVPFGRAAAVRVNVQENFDQIGPHVHDLLSADEWQALSASQLTFLQRRAAWFDARASGGHVRDGHGDLRLEHVYFEGSEVVIVDCIEFSDRFRFADTALDVAFLSMDLRRLGRWDQAEDFLAEVAARSGDYEAYALVDFYEAYRATVRGKVAALRERQVGLGAREAKTAHDEARAYFLQALACLAARKPPRLICFGGLMASGKSTLARMVAGRLHCPVVDTDGQRKRLHGVDALVPLTSAPFAGAYSDEATEQTYAHVLELGRTILSSGRSVVVDASFRTRHWRKRFAALAEACDAPLSFVECRASDAVTRERLLRRAEGPSRSDGRLGTLGAFRAAFEAIEEHEVPHLLRCDTSSSDDAARDRVLDFLDLR